MLSAGKNIRYGRKTPAADTKKAAAQTRSGFEKSPNYLVTLSSHLSMASIVNIESTQATTKTVQVIQIGICS